MTTALAALPQTEETGYPPVAASRGHIDTGYFFRSLSGDGGYLVVS